MRLLYQDDTRTNQARPSLDGARRNVTRRIALMTTDVYAGKDLGTLDLTITDEMVQHYIKGLDEPNPWYTTTSPFGGPVAPVIVYQDADSQFKGWSLTITTTKPPRRSSASGTR
jgi:hypothetical protein